MTPDDARAMESREWLTNMPDPEKTETMFALAALI